MNAVSPQRHPHAGPRRRLLTIACVTGLVMLLASLLQSAAALGWAPTAATGVVGRWPLDDGANPTADVSGNARHAALSGDPAFTADRPAVLGGSALDFDGVNDYLTLGGAESDYDLNVMTIALWVNVDAFTTSYQAFITKGDNSWRIQRNEGFNYIHFVTDGLTNQGLNSSIELNDNQWHHLVAIYDGSRKYLYIDGVLDTSAPATGTINNNNFPVTVGMNNQFNSRFFDGQMDDIRIYSRALSAEDVAKLYAANSSPTAADDTYVTVEDASLAVAAPGVLANDSHVDGKAITPILLTSPANGALQFSANGSFAYTPTADFAGTDSFSYAVYDDANLAAAGYWPFDDGANPTADASGNGHAGALLNGAAFTTTVPITLGNGMAMSFDGVDDRVEASPIDLANSSFTVAFWAQRPMFGSQNFVLSQGTASMNSELHIGFRDSGRFTCAFWANDLDTSVPYMDTDWHHWACTYDSATRRRTIYRDGVAVASDTASAHYQGSGPISIGTRANGTEAFRGLVDDVRIYRQALPAALIAQAMTVPPGTGQLDTATVTIDVSEVNDAPVAVDDSYTTTQGAALVRNGPYGDLSTIAAGGIQHDGNMFDVTAGARDINVTGFDIYTSQGGVIDVAVYYKAGSYVGSERSPANWTLLGIETVDAQGNNTPTHVSIGGLEIPAGAIYGLYVTSLDPWINLSYTNGANSYTNGDMTITTGTGNGYPFGAVNTPRTWNGTIYYGSGPTVLTNDSDVESALSTTLATAPANGDLTLNSDGGFVYTPALSFAGQDTFSYIASDGVLTDTATVTVTVTPAPCAVEASGDSLTDYASADASALRNAAAAASPGATLKVAGICAGVQQTAGLTQTLYLDQDLTIRGGYTQTAWLAAADPALYPSILDAQAGGRVVSVAGPAAVTLDGLRITNGSAEHGAGLALSSGAAVTATNTLFTNNTATGDGGAILNSGGALTITGSSFYTNTAQRGGGLYIYANGVGAVANSTFAYNQAAEGGGIHSRGALTVTHATFGYNTATSGSAVQNQEGQLAIYNTLMGDNSDQDCVNAGTLVASVNNLIEGGSCDANLTSRPGLAELGDHGGATRTIALEPDSAAIDAAADPHCPASDQRGMLRPQGAACDIGAYEAEQVELTIAFAGTGAGAIEINQGDLAPITCNQTCTVDVVPGRALTLTATPAASSRFAGWSDPCSGAAKCTITVDAARTLTATFTLFVYDLNVTRAGTGSGRITSSPAGIDCGATCSAVVGHGAVLTLTATPAAGSTFTGWSGACSGTGPCVITMAGRKDVTATFETASSRLFLPLLVR